MDWRRCPVPSWPRKSSGCWPSARGSPPIWPCCPGRFNHGKSRTGWDELAATFAEKAGVIVAEHGEGQPDLAAFGVMVEAEEARRLGRDTRTTWEAVAEAWRVAGWPYREAYARLREAAAAIQGRPA